MSTTEDVNSAEPQDEAPLGERLLASIEILSEDLSSADRLTEYQLRRPELVELYESDPVAFDLVAKAIAKKLRVKLGALRRDIASLLPPAEEVREAKPEQGTSQATRLVTLAQDADLWHTPEGDVYATIPVNGHKEHWLLGSKNFRRWLRRRYYEQYSGAPGSQAMQDALGVLEARAQFEGPERPVFVRVAEYEGSIYIDLADSEWRAAQITASGWDIIPDPPVKFRRPRGMQALPQPQKGGDVQKLRTFLNIADDKAWILLLSWLVMALCPKGPFPVLVLHGEQGTAKSTLARILKTLIDANEAPLRAEPREERDLMVAAGNSWLLVFDNISRLPVWLSDSLCRLATGGGFATRELYTDREEAIFTAQRPIILNGIEEVATRGDLLDRSVSGDCPVIPEEKRKAEKQLWMELGQDSPGILGGLLDAVSMALRNIASVQLEKLPRMADFARWTIAAAPALGFTPEAFLEAYSENRQALHRVVLEGSLIAPAVCALIEKKPWEGIATQLLERLTQDNAEAAKKKDWPQSPQGLSNILRRLAPNLREMGVAVEFDRDSGRRRARKITISQLAQAKEQSEEQPRENPGEQPPEQPGNSSSAASEVSEPQQNRDPRRTMADDPPASSDDPSQDRDEKASEPNTKDSEDLSDRRTMPDTSDDKILAYSNGGNSNSSPSAVGETANGDATQTDPSPPNAGNAGNAVDACEEPEVDLIAAEEQLAMQEEDGLAVADVIFVTEEDSGI